MKTQLNYITTNIKGIALDPIVIRTLSAPVILRLEDLDGLFQSKEYVINVTLHKTQCFPPSCSMAVQAQWQKCNACGLLGGLLSVNVCDLLNERSICSQ